MSGITTRIWLKYEGGGDILCTSDVNELYHIVNKPFEGTNTEHIGIGTIINLIGDSNIAKEHEVVEIRPYLWDKRIWH